MADYYLTLDGMPPTDAERTAFLNFHVFNPAEEIENFLKTGIAPNPLYTAVMKPFMLAMFGKIDQKYLCVTCDYEFSLSNGPPPKFVFCTSPAMDDGKKSFSTMSGAICRKCAKDDEKEAAFYKMLPLLKKKMPSLEIARWGNA